MKYIFVICKIYKSINIHNNKNGYKILEQTLHKGRYATTQSGYANCSGPHIRKMQVQD